MSLILPNFASEISQERVSTEPQLLISCEHYQFLKNYNYEKDYL